MDVLASYKFHDDPGTTRPVPNKSSRVRYSVEDSCSRFPDGCIVENLHNNGGAGGLYELLGGLRKISYRNGQPYSHTSSGSLERILGIHFGYDAKKFMKNYFRPNIKNVKDETCRSCLVESCDCGPLGHCTECWWKCYEKCD